MLTKSFYLKSVEIATRKASADQSKLKTRIKVHDNGNNVNEKFRHYEVCVVNLFCQRKSLSWFIYTYTIFMPVAGAGACKKSGKNKEACEEESLRSEGHRRPEF